MQDFTEPVPCQKRPLKMPKTTRQSIATRVIALAAPVLLTACLFGASATTVSASTGTASTGTAKVGRLDSISCPTTTFCMAVGSGSDRLSPTNVTNAVLEYDNGTWFTAPFANPSSTDTNWQTVSCSSPTFCVAAGVTAGLDVAVAEFTGTWTVFRGSTIHYGQFASSMQASCSGDVCVIGGYANASTLIVTDSSVSSEALPVPGGDTVKDMGFWCGSTKLCRAAGYATDSKGVTVNLTFAWDGTSWSTWGKQTYAGVLGTPLECSTSSFCITWNALLKANVMSIDHYNGSTWSVENTSFTGHEPDTDPAALSCVSSTFCVQAGQFYNNDATSFLPMAYVMSGSTWRMSNLPTIGKFGWLAGVSCASTTDCYAVGMYTTNATVAGATWLSELLHYNGSSWARITVSGLN